MGTDTPTDEEYIIEGDVLISQTDLEGVITYVNRAFCKVSGYTSEELIDKPHNIIRHPEMPKAEFARMWKNISGGQAWNGLIINLRKDEKYYWVETEILPIKNEDDKITGYIAVMKEASRKNINDIKEKYNTMLETQE